MRGAEVVAMASGRRTVVEDIVSLAQSLPVAAAGASVNVMLADDIDLSRGDMLAYPSSPPRAVKTIDARICWLSSLPLDARAVSSERFVLKHTTRSVSARLASLESRVDVNALEEHAAPAGLVMNDIARVSLTLAQPVFVDSYRNDRTTGSFILIDEVTHQTLAAGMIE
jgi:sulfate adenylyltransferase subunit 1